MVPLLVTLLVTLLLGGGDLGGYASDTMALSSSTRRRFLAGAAKAAAAVALTGLRSTSLAAQQHPAAGSSDSALIDSHTHFYNPLRPQGVPWPPRDDKLLYRRVLPADYRAQPVPRLVTGTVVVEASSWLEDNQWILNLAARDSFIVGFVGHLPIGTKGFAGHLKRFAENELFRGVRLSDRKLDGALDDPAFVSDLKLLADADLSVDLLGGLEILPFADRLAKNVPGLRIVIDHLAGLSIDGKALPVDWINQMRQLAGTPGIYFKLSGLVEGTGRTYGSAPGDVEFYRPVLDAMREMFGPERLIYASNWPVSGRFASLATVQSIIADYFRGQGRRAEQQVFALAARSAYKWVAREKPEH